MKTRCNTLRVRKPAYLMPGLLVTALCPSLALADNWADKISLTGFMSAKYQQIGEDNYFNGDSQSGIGKEGSLRGTMVGLNLTAPIDNGISFASQFLATQEDDNYSTHLDWGFIALDVTNRLKFRAGKLKFPTGIVNEYVSVGNAYPWISPPMLFYTEEGNGPNVTREAYTGANAYYEYSRGDINMSMDLFGGEIRLEEMTVRKMTGLKAYLDWNEEIAFQASYYQGTMRNVSGHMSVMEGRAHTNLSMGMRLDWNDIIGYAEWSNTDMETETMNGNSWYTTLGYQIDDWLPHLTYQHFDKGKDSSSPQEQNMVTAGLRYDLSDVAALKFEYSIINTEKGRGLFESAPADDQTDLFGTSIDVVF